MKSKREKYNADNVLGWSEHDFDEVKIAICKVRFANNLPLTASLLKTWCQTIDADKYEFLKPTPNDR